MAGGYKLFSTGEVLTAANVNNYLMNQTVMVFASAAARTTALSGVLAEGMISYRSDAKVLEIYNGTSWITESAFVSPLTTKGDVHTYSTTDARLGVGTTNQTLIVDSTQTTGLKWAASPQSTLSAKGSLVSASAANTLAELTVGTDGQTLVANSAATTGLQWASTPSASNPVLNSAMQVWQRGTSFAIASSTATYTADRWCVQRNATGSTISRQATGDTTNLPFIQYGLRIQRDSGNTSTQLIAASQSFESVNSIPFAGKTITVSFYAKAGANYSSASSVFKMQIYSGTGTDQNVLSGLTGSAVVIDGSATLTTTYQRFTFTGTVAATATQLAIYSFYTPVGTAGANDWAEITGVQIDIGSVALPFRTFSQTLQGELAACQRYYVRIGDANGASNQRLARGSANSTTGVQLTATLPVQLRTGASSTIDYANLQWYNGLGGVGAISSITMSATSTTNPAISAVTTSVVSGTFYELLTTSTAGYIGFSAEL